jgi:hypothetical protein
MKMLAKVRHGQTLVRIAAVRIVMTEGIVSRVGEGAILPTETWMDAGFCRSAAAQR